MGDAGKPEDRSLDLMHGQVGGIATRRLLSLTLIGRMRPGPVVRRSPKRTSEDWWRQFGNFNFCMTAWKRGSLRSGSKKKLTFVYARYGSRIRIAVSSQSRARAVSPHCA